jgi:hypothetical protein
LEIDLKSVFHPDRDYQKKRPGSTNGRTARGSTARPEATRMVGLLRR